MTIKLPVRPFLLLASALLLPAPPAVAATPEKDDLTLERIMADPDWLGLFPENPYWADDGRAVYFHKKRSADERAELWRLDLAGCPPAAATATAGCAPRRVPPEELGRVDAPGGSWSKDRRFKVYAREGDVYLREVATGTVRQLTRTGQAESDPFFLVGDREVAYRRGDSFFVRDLASGLERQPAELRLEKDPADLPTWPPGKEDQEVLAEQQRRLFSTLREREARERREREEARTEQRADPSRPPLPWYLGDDVEVRDQTLSPDAAWLLLQLDPKGTEEGPRDRMAELVSESGYVEMRQVRPKVGTVDRPSPRLVLLDLRGHQRYDLDLGVLPGIHDDPLKELRDRAQAARQAERTAKEQGRDQSGGEAGGKGDKKAGKDMKSAADSEREQGSEAEKPKERTVEVDRIAWNEQGDRIALQLLSDDNKDRWIAEVDLKAGKLIPRERMTDTAWINEYTFLDLGWLRDGRTLWYLSEEDGWSHLYLRAADGARRQLTRGTFEVSEPFLTPDGSAFYLTANREHPGIQETYRLSLPDGGLERLTTLGGLSTSLLSPDGSRLLVLHSKPTEPPELYLQEIWQEARQDARRGGAAARLTDSRSAEFKAIRWSLPEVVGVPSTHGAPGPIWSRVYTPPAPASAEVSAGKGRPAVVFIHGAGYLQNAHLGWSSYFREFMFHSLLTRQGYVVLDLDYRASAGYGRAWRTAIYRRMGTPEVEDLADVVAWLVAQRGVDAERVGVYGGSYGGFLTFMALFRQPDLFACGAALRPVSDWAHYNHGYTSNILNTPEVDPEAYAVSSPIEFAAGLDKPLLIAHGMVDDNVVFQDTVRLVQRLIELGKQDFETAIYPVEPHSFREPASWLDEYRRIDKLFEGCLKK